MSARESKYCDDAGDCGFAGNFRGVCPIIGRLRMSYRGVDRLAMDKYRPFVPVFSMSGNDTHGYAVRTSRRTE